MSCKLALRLPAAAACLLSICPQLLGQAGRARVEPRGQQRIARPQAQPLRIAKLSPQLERILGEWSTATSRVRKLEGRHNKFEYDSVFSVERRATGKFYYEAPDKGRIDIEPVRIANGELSRRKGKSGAPYKIESAKNERWICDGKTVLQVDDAAKKVEFFPLPDTARGQNIMDGPLPFLFGMPPEKARQRYMLELLRETKSEVWLKVSPRWRSDRANYKEAKVILDRRNYLPRAVQLIDPTGNGETVYTFFDVEANKEPRFAIFKKLIGRGNGPFAPDLGGYKKETVYVKSKTSDPKKTAAVPQYRAVPDVLGKPFKEATADLQKYGFKVEFRKGQVVEGSSRFLYRVQKQTPEANRKFPVGQKVVLTLYVKAQDVKRTASK